MLTFGSPHAHLGNEDLFTFQTETGSIRNNGPLLRRKSMRKTAGLIAAIAITASALIAAPAHAAGTTITAGGSSFAGGMVATCAANYNDATVNYNPEGSGGGKTKFAAGTYDFAGTDSLYAAGAEAKNFTYVPLLGGPIALAFNVDGVKNLRLDANAVSGIFMGTITKWNDAAIANLNKGVKLPAAAITPEYRSGTSGTTNNFAGYLKANTTAGWTQNDSWALSTGKSTPAGTGNANSTALIASVKATPNSIGYVDLKDAISSNLSYAFLKNAAGQFVKPTAAAAAKFLSTMSPNANGSVTIDWAKKVPGAYNASLFTYGLAHTATSTNGEAVKAFFNYMLNTCVPANGTRLGFVALTGAIKAKALALAATIK
jgi:phosphate transport system substrate-binding protein